MWSKEERRDERKVVEGWRAAFWFDDGGRGAPFGGPAGRTRSAQDFFVGGAGAGAGTGAGGGGDDTRKSSIFGDSGALGTVGSGVGEAPGFRVGVTALGGSGGGEEMDKTGDEADSEVGDLATGTSDTGEDAGSEGVLSEIVFSDIAFPKTGFSEFPFSTTGVSVTFSTGLFSESFTGVGTGTCCAFPAIGNC